MATSYWPAFAHVRANGTQRAWARWQSRRSPGTMIAGARSRRGSMSTCRSPLIRRSSSTCLPGWWARRPAPQRCATDHSLRALAQDLCDGDGGGRHGLPVVLAQQRRHGCRNLGLAELRGVGALAERSSVRAQPRDPYVLRAWLLDTVLFPIDRSAAAAMIRRDDERSLIPVRRQALQGIPELLDEVIEEVRAVENQVVAAGVRPVVSLAVADEQYARLVFAKRVEQRDLQERVVDIPVVQPGREPVELVQQLLPGGELGAIGQVPSDLQRKIAAPNVEDILERLPGCVHADEPVQIRQTVQPFEYRRVGIRAELVRVDARIGVPGQHFIVSGVREGQPVGDTGDAAFGLVAEDLAARRDRRPQERKQGLAAFVRVFAPEFAAQVLLLVPDAAVFRVHQGGVGAGENLLPANTIADQEYDVVRLRRGRRLSARGGLQHGQCQKNSTPAGPRGNPRQHHSAPGPVAHHGPGSL